MELERDDPRAGFDEPRRQRAGAGADVEDEISGANAAVGDELLRPAVSELMPSPMGPPAGGHDAPSP